MRPSLVALVVLVLSVVFASCAQPQEPTLDVAPTARTLVSGDNVQLTVTRRFSGGAVEDVTGKVTYTTSDKALATILDKGVLVAGNNSGSVIIRVFDPTSDASGAATFTVVPAAIQSIEVSPSPALVLQKGGKHQFTANAVFSNGTTSDVTTQVIWSTTNEAAATVGNTAADKGLVNAVSPGETDILATDSQTRVQGRSIVFVTGENTTPALTAIVVTPNPGVVAVGKTQQFAALGVSSDGTTQDLSRLVTWSSARTDLATVDTLGVVTGVAAGDTTITATAPEPNTAIKGSAAAKVTP